MSRTLETEGASVALDEHRVVRVTITETDLQRSNVEDIDAAVWELAGDEPPDVIIDARLWQHATAEARKRATEGRSYNRLAVVVDGPAFRRGRRLLHARGHAPHPSKSFRSVDEAHGWLLAKRGE